MKSHPGTRSRKRIEDLRIPAVKGLPDDIYHMLHHSFVDIVRMRRRIESIDALIDQSMEAILESWEMLKRRGR
jgi:hypothetical protein